MLLEVIVQSVGDAREAARGGADRLEVVRAILQGGLTPALPLVREIAAETGLPLRVMIRENAGYATDGTELPVLRRAAAQFAAEQVDGLVIGFLRGRAPSRPDVEAALAEAPSARVTFHRAFDDCLDPLLAIDTLAAMRQVDRILTSGGDGDAVERCERLRQYTIRAGGRFTIVAGGGVTEEMLALLARTQCVREVHVGRAAREGEDPQGPVSAARVRRLRELIVA
jgi:copper homeostasis protein